MTTAHSDPVLTVVTPAFREQDNLRPLRDQMIPALEATGVSFEWLIVDDHSPDDTLAVARELADADSRIRAIRLAHNVGSHLAVRAGIAHSRGQATIVMAADLQDPPAVIGDLLEQWRDGFHVVWAARRLREGEKRSRLAFSNLYWWIMRRVVGIATLPANGADFFLLDRRVIDALSRYRERDTSILALIAWVGFRQTVIEYDKQARLHGTSGWSFSKKIKLVLDSVISFSYLPIRMMSLLGVLIALSGFIWAAGVVVSYLVGANPPTGWSSTIMAILLIGGTQMVMLGVIGEYLWRTLEQARRRPLWLVEEAVGTLEPAGPADPPPTHDVHPPDDPD